MDGYFQMDWVNKYCRVARVVSLLDMVMDVMDERCRVYRMVRMSVYEPPGVRIVGRDEKSCRRTNVRGSEPLGFQLAGALWW